MAPGSTVLSEALARKHFDASFLIDDDRFDHGVFGSVFRCVSRKTGHVCVAKIAREDSFDLNRESDVLQKLHHENVVRFVDRASAHGRVYAIIMEHGGTPLVDIVLNGCSMDASQMECTMRKAVAYLHRRGICHLDLKLENMTLSNSGVLRIIDFGMARIVEPGELVSGLVGSRSYCAPEVLRDRHFCPVLADVWSLGICIFAMYTSHFPFKEASLKDGSFLQMCDIQKHNEYGAVEWIAKQTRKPLSEGVARGIDPLLRVDLSKRSTSFV